MDGSYGLLYKLDYQLSFGDRFYGKLVIKWIISQWKIPLNGSVVWDCQFGKITLLH
jgi:hypothetical protein